MILHKNEAGQLHREDGPAVECADGGYVWYRNGLRHRIDGPAYSGLDGISFWIDGNEYTNLDEYCDAAGIIGRRKTLFLLTYSGVALEDQS